MHSLSTSKKGSKQSAVAVDRAASSRVDERCKHINCYACCCCAGGTCAVKTVTTTTSNAAVEQAKSVEANNPQMQLCARQVMAAGCVGEHAPASGV